MIANLQSEHPEIDITPGNRESERVLLVLDDDRNLEETLSLHLIQDQRSVSIVQTGTTALECIQQETFDLVLLDLQLRDMSGLSVLMALREIHSPTRLPVIVMTALSQSENIIQALQKGANDYVTKPINFPELRARVHAQLLRGAATRESEERYALAAQGANDGLWDWNLETDRVYFSSRWKSMLGCAENEVSNHPDEWFKRVHPDDILRLKQEIADHLQGVTSHLESQHRLLHKDGTYRWMNVRGVTARKGKTSPVRMAGSHNDITHGKVADALTGLPNRALFLERLEACLDRVRRQGGPMFAVVFLDVDRFKGVNDRLGHSMGDQLLIAISRRLETCLQSKDTVSRMESENLLARLGGDEFTILLDNVQELSQATSIADRILKELGAPFNLDGNEVFTTASIGIALSSSVHERAVDLLRDADTAMYEAKAQGKGRYEVFDTFMRDQMQARQQLESELRRAVATQEFVVHYQPIFSLSNGQLSGFEALLRWQHPERGLLGPSEFISVAEETGLSLSLDQWVLRQATRQMKDWQDRHTDHLTISVNFSSCQFQQLDIVEQVRQVLRETGLDGSKLELEITETQMMENRESVSSVLLALRALNVHLAIDDFGTGYSSLSYIQRFPVQRLKIDRSFVSKMCLDQEDRAIVQTIIALAHNLRLDLVAEGVETAEQLADLKELGCEYAQGYFFSQPVDSIAAEELITRSEPVISSGSETKCLEEVAAIKSLLAQIKDLEKEVRPGPPSEMPSEVDLAPCLSNRTLGETSIDDQTESAAAVSIGECYREGKRCFERGDFEQCRVLMGEILQHSPCHQQANWYWNESQRKQEEQRLKDELEIHLEDVKKDAMDRFDRECYGECQGIFSFLSELEPENHQWGQYLELSRQLVSEKQDILRNTTKSNVPKEESASHEDASTAAAVEQALTVRDMVPSTEMGLQRSGLLARFSVGMGSRKLQHLRSSIHIPQIAREVEMEFATPLERTRGTRLLMTVIIVLLAFITIPIFHRSDKVGPPLVTGRLESTPRQGGAIKNSENRLATTMPQETNAERWEAAGQGVSNGLMQPSVASSRSPKDLRPPHQQIPQPPIRESAANKGAFKGKRASSPNERVLQHPLRGVDVETTWPVDAALQNANQKHASRPHVYSVVHEHVLGSCQGTLTVDGKSIVFESLGNSRDGFKSSLSEIIGIEVRDALKIRFKNRIYHFKADTGRGKEADRAEVEAIYGELTRFSK
jgi:diguanylate cyclase (GGDEF)-like protein/PAS domain S-box-containing protein